MSRLAGANEMIEEKVSGSEPGGATRREQPPPRLVSQAIGFDPGPLQRH